MSETIRVKYVKRDTVKYVGHLDTMRTFIRCLKRTSIPVEYSKGFNPRIQISFALPLGVGVTSECEFFDLTLLHKMNVDVFLSELNSTLPDGFRVISADYPSSRKSLMSLVKEAIYEIKIFDTIDWNKVHELFNGEELLVKKQIGKEMKYQNIKDGLISFDTNSNVITVHVTAGSSKNINPHSIIEIINQNVAEVTDFDICRKELILSE